MSCGKKKHICILLLAAIVPMMLFSCQRRDLYRLEEKLVYLELDIDTTVLHGKAEMPEIMVAAFYSAATGDLVSYEFVDPRGGWLHNVSPGKYEMLVYNFNTSPTIVKDENNFKTALAYTEVGETNHSISGKGRIGPVINMPDHLYVSRKNVDLMYNSVSDTLLYHCGEESKKDSIMSIYHHCVSIMDTYHFKAMVRKGLSYISRAEVYITGHSSSNLFGPDLRSDKNAVIHFPVHRNESGNCLDADFVTFGAIPGEVNRVYLEITSSGRNDGPNTYIVDVTDQFVRNKENGYNIVIDPGIEIEPGEGGGGLDPGIDDWEEVEKDLL